MKICPRCHSSYSDETLNFCLTDGVPLIAEAASVSGGASQQLSSSQHSWQEAETLHDSGFIFPAAVTGGEHTTSPNSGSPTFASSASHTAAVVDVVPPRKSSNRVLPLIVGALLAAGLAGGAFWYFGGQKDENSAINSRSSIPSVTVEVKKTSVALSGEQENQIKKEITQMIETWRSSIEKHDIDTHIKAYVATLENYYKESGIHREHVRADRLRAFERYPTISLQIDNMKITPHSLESATVVFDKTWTFKRPQRTSTGSVQQEMELIKQNGRWLINGEKDAKVYYINNRDNPPEEDNANQNANSGSGNSNTNSN
ncbi:MAG: hypothetical protein M3384_12490 [Acidobacteriota bacterium]|nr:hypothetical protein [Acidobacteriota bacterium]